MFWDMKAPTRKEWVANKLKEWKEGVDVNHPAYLQDNQFVVPEARFPIRVGAKWASHVNDVVFEFQCFDTEEGGEQHESEYTGAELEAVEGDILLFDREWDSGWNYLSPDIEVKIPTKILRHLVSLAKRYRS